MTSPHADRIDAHLRDMVAHHFSPETGTPFWLARAKAWGWDPRHEVHTVADLARFPPFDKAWLRDAPHPDWTPRALARTPPHLFETGGTTGVPTQRLSWRDHLDDYERLSDALDPDAFPPGAPWLILGPTGPRRLRLSMEHLARHRGGVAHHVDLDPRWVRRLLANGDATTAARYQAHVVAQARTLLQHRPIACLFTTPRLLEALGDAMSITDAGVRGVLLGGTSMPPEVLRLLHTEVLDGQVALQPVYGNTLMGVAPARPLDPATFEPIYQPPTPRALLRVVDDAGQTVPYGARGRVELTTLTPELFLPRLLERDTAIRRPPPDGGFDDGVADVRPMAAPDASPTIEGVY